MLRKWTRQGNDPLDFPSYAWYRDNGGLLGLEPYPEWFVAHLVEGLQRGKHALKPTGSMRINIGDTYFSRWDSIRHDGRQGLGNSRPTACASKLPQAQGYARSAR